VDLESAAFKREYFVHMDERDLAELQETENLKTFLTIDPSYTGKSDKSGFVVASTDSDNKLYVRKVIEKRMKLVEVIGMMFRLIEAYEPDGVGMQHVDWTKSFEVPVREEMRRRNKFFRVTPLATYSQRQGMFNKKSWIERLSPRYASGQIIHVGDQGTLEMELVAFPRSKNDDAIDALSMQLDLIWPAQKKSARRKYPKYLDDIGVDSISGY
jgi:hypothetical protein